jgi:hypothetical protein
MSEKLLLQAAQHAYAQFINGLSPSQARNVRLGEVRPAGPTPAHGQPGRDA